MYSVIYFIVAFSSGLVEALRLLTSDESEIYCLVQDAPANAKGGLQGKFPIHTQLRFPCIPGHTADGLASGPDFVQLECGPDGNFLPSNLFLADCKPVNCGRGPEIPHARISDNPAEIRFGNSAQYACVGNFTTSTGPNFQVACMGNGAFETPPVCSTVTCGAPPPQLHATPMQEISVPLGESMRYSCESGFAVSSDVFSFDLACAWHPIDQQPYFAEANKERCLPIS